MKAVITIEITATSSSGYPMQLETKLEEAVSEVLNTVDGLSLDENYKIVYNNWEDPHPMELETHTRTEYDTR